MSKKKEPKTVLPEPETKAPEGKEIVSIPYHFSNEEKLELSMRHAVAHQQIEAITDQVKSITADLKAQIKAKQAEAQSLGTKITSGFEYRETECRVTYDAKKGRKFYRPKNSEPESEPVKECEMTTDDYQLHFPEPPPFTSMGQAIAEAEKVPAGDPIEDAKEQVKIDKRKASDERENAFK